MNEKQLKTFITVAKYGSFTRAEQDIYISKQALKKQIDSLEQEIGVPLFIRSGRGLSLTPAGIEFLDGAGQILALIDSKIDECRAAAADDSLKLAVFSDIVATFIIEIGSRFSGEFPEFNLRYEKISTSDWLDAVQSGKVSACLYPPNDYEIERRGLCHSLITSQPVYCLMSNANPLAGKQLICPSDLCGQKIYVGRRHWYREIIESLEEGDLKIDIQDIYTKSPTSFDGIGAGIEVEELIYSFYYISQICFTGGICLLSKKTTTYFPQLAAIPLNIKPRFHFGIAYRPEPSPAIIKLIETARRFCEEPPGAS